MASQYNYHSHRQILPDGTSIWFIGLIYVPAFDQILSGHNIYFGWFHSPSLFLSWLAVGVRTLIAMSSPATWPRPRNPWFPIIVPLMRLSQYYVTSRCSVGQIGDCPHWIAKRRDQATQAAHHHHNTGRWYGLLTMHVSFHSGKTTKYPHPILTLRANMDRYWTVTPPTTRSVLMTAK